MSFLYGTGRYNPKISILSHKDKNMTFKLENADLSFANSLRRIIIAEVPTMAIDLVTVNENTSPLFDEYIVHRLGLIPLVSESIDDYEYSLNCNCKEGCCPKCSVEFKIKVRCEDTEMNVTTDHIEPINEKCPVIPYKYDPPILITKLRKNQRLEMRLTAKKGVGKEHSKWSPVSCCILQQIPEFELLDEEKLKNLTLSEKKEFINSCPSKVYKLDERENDIIADKINQCTFCQECYDKFNDIQNKKYNNNGKKGDKVTQKEVFKISAKKNVFIFKIESNGSLSPKKILLKAFQIMKEKCKLVYDEIPEQSYKKN